MSLLPSPVDFGLPAHFTEWRRGQDEAVLHALEAPERFVGMVLPTGAGKSLIYMASIHLRAARGVVLTSTKALQRQLGKEFGGMAGTALVQGQRAYICKALQPTGELFGLYGRQSGEPLAVDHGPCHTGVDCSLKLNGCYYYDAVRRAVRGTVTITNYAWWFTLKDRPDIRLVPDLLVLDEAHAAPDALADALGADVHARDVYDLLGQRLSKPEQLSEQGWVDWAGLQAKRLGAMLEGTRPSGRDAAMRLRRAQWLHRALVKVATMDSRLLLRSDAPDGVRFDLVWAAPYAEGLLFRGVPKVLLTSATFTSHTAELLGIAPNDLSLFEAGDGFPKERRPVWLVKTCKVDKNLTPELERYWLARIDQILSTRQDRKGIIHCVSYRRRDTILARSEYREQMMTHGRHNTAEQIRKFKAAPAGTIFVSPAITTGYDFPYDQAEYQIVCKIPFPDTRDPVTAARTAIDKRYPMHVAMQQFVQSVGRGMRAADDRCETLVVDDNARWFMAKHGDLAPRWFRRAIRRVDLVPAPPPRLDRTVSGEDAGGDDSGNSNTPTGTGDGPGAFSD